MHETDKTKLLDQTKLRLYEIKKKKIVLLLILINKKNTVKNEISMLLFLVI